ncbi:hypothetical protein CD928_16105 [Sphingopyxis sp. GW247-27LB]|nr:hypothetical protein CD928_16105 [Sphingopyxis sp. GW247-27LB]
MQNAVSNLKLKRTGLLFRRYARKLVDRTGACTADSGRRSIVRDRFGLTQIFVRRWAIILDKSVEPSDLIGNDLIERAHAAALLDMSLP